MIIRPAFSGFAQAPTLWTDLKKEVSLACTGAACNVPGFTYDNGDVYAHNDTVHKATLYASANELYTCHYLQLVRANMMDSYLVQTHCDVHTAPSVCEVNCN